MIKDTHELAKTLDALFAMAEVLASELGSGGRITSIKITRREDDFLFDFSDWSRERGSAVIPTAPTETAATPPVSQTKPQPLQKSRPK